MASKTREKPALKAVRRVGENLWLRHGWYYARLKKNGKDIWKTLETADRNIANANLLKFKGKISAHTPSPKKGEVPTLHAACDVLVDRARNEIKRPRTFTTLQGSLNCVKESFLAPMLMNRIGLHHIKDYLHKRAGDRSGRTANHDLTAIRKLFKLAVEKGWRWDDPTQGIKAFPHQEKKVPVPSLEEIKSILAAMRDGRMRKCFKAANFVELLALSGLRLAEAQALLWEDIDLQKGILIVREGKGGKSRIVDLSPSLRAFTERLLDGQKSRPELVFPPQQKKRPYTPRTALESACKIAKVPRFSFHGLRHAWATELVKAGIDFGTIAQWAGHSDGGMLIAKRYGRHMRRDHMQMAAQKATFNVTQPAVAVPVTT